ncbi:MAG: SgcJ/EcaC family oxidoreductase [Terracidiphilus sp.]|jgi:uncharacterized protein (TIGR02246 family)
MLHVGLLSIALLLPAALMGQGSQNADRQAIRGVTDGFMDAWNRHDAKAFAALFSEDADFTNVRGAGASGRAEIEKFHAPLFATIFKDTKQKHTYVTIRFIRPDVAAVDVRWEMTGVEDPAGNPLPVRHGLLNFTMAKDQGKWQIVVMHNMDLAAPPPAPK